MREIQDDRKREREMIKKEIITEITEIREIRVRERERERERE